MSNLARVAKYGESSSSSAHLPPELVLRMLARLPVESFCRFRRVSSSRNSIILDPQLVDLQFEPSKLYMFCTYSRQSNDWVERPQYFALEPPRSTGSWNSTAALLYTTFKDLNRSGHDIIFWIFKGFDELQRPWSCKMIAKPPDWMETTRGRDVTMEGTVPSGELLFRHARPSSPFSLFYYNLNSGIVRTVDVSLR
ncbi:hypothetical protein CRG98_003501 [Punica granatum]|uniref:F-box domain-containing protein n=1 Tax=Punica granatum TaxID=22663 RepID=A0A2I0L687_PUNGR|nr:hypothetical protein CRG98_003501 [Punica granatum]